jgi:glycosyltransferase involved in cell wall biosynthesis
VPDRPIRVLFVSQHYAPELTGNAPYVASLAEALAERGFAVRVLTTHPHYPHWRIEEGYGGWRTVEHPRSGLSVTRLLHYVPASPSTVRRTIAEVTFGFRALFARWGHPDVVVLVSPGLLGARIARIRARRAPAFVVWVQDIYSLGLRETGQGQGLLARLLERVERVTVSRPAQIMAIHERFKDYLVNNLGAAPTNVEVIRNWTHLDPTGGTGSRAASRSALGWSDDETIVLHAGNQGVKQGLSNVVESARLSDVEGLPIRFVLLGHGNQHDMLRSEAEGVQRIQFIEPLPDDQYQAAMRAADMLLVNELPGVAEMSVPSKLTSYFSTGVPVLAATDAGSVTAGEVAAAKAGLRVDAGRPRAMVDGVLEIAGLADKGAALGSAGPEYVRSVLSKNAAIEHVERWFVELLDGRQD